MLVPVEEAEVTIRKVTFQVRNTSDHAIQFEKNVALDALKGGLSSFD
jgi:hypothetical protein